MIINKDELDAVHPRLKQLSYSGLLELHSCARRYQLNKLRANTVREDNTTFAFGHAVGLGIQLSMQGLELKDIYFQMFINWSVDIYAEEQRARKSLFYAMQAVQMFHAQKNSYVLDDGTKLADYDLATFEDKPAVELSFRIDVMNGFAYRGYVDAVLLNRYTKEYIVLELKTTALTQLDEAMYKNSAQALGYSIVLDMIASGHSSYRVLYLIYKSGKEEFELMSFDKSFTKRADWIRDLVMDVNILGYYNSQDAFPMRGESCYSFFRQCTHFNICQMSDKVLIDYAKIAEEDSTRVDIEYQINISLLDLIDSQISREVGN